MEPVVADPGFHFDGGHGESKVQKYKNWLKHRETTAIGGNTPLPPWIHHWSMWNVVTMHLKSMIILLAVLPYSWRNYSKKYVSKVVSMINFQIIKGSYYANSIVKLDNPFLFGRYFIRHKKLSPDFRLVYYYNGSVKL